MESIEKETVHFPHGGAVVSIGEDVQVVRGLDCGELTGRGVAIVVFDGEERKIYPESATQQVNKHFAKTQNSVVIEEPRGERHPISV